MMKTDTSLQKFKSYLFYGVKTGAVPLFLFSLVFGSILAIGLKAMMWDITLTMAIVASLLTITPFIVFAFLGVVVISAVVAANKKLSNVAVFLVGLWVGLVIVGIADYFLSVLVGYDFLLLPSTVTVVLLAYVGQKINRHANRDSSMDIELRGSLWMVFVVFIGSLVFVLIHYNAYLISLDTYVYLGSALSFSLPFAILIGFLMGFVIKKVRKPA
jgi:hypothetical protein